MLSALDSFPAESIVVLALLPVAIVVDVGRESSFLVGLEYISFCHDAHNNDKGKAHRLKIKLRELASALQMERMRRSVRPTYYKDMERKFSFARRVTSSLALLLLLADACAAGDFSIREALLLARRNDPIYLAARAKFEAAHARRSQARSYLMPQLMVKGTATQTDRRYETLDTIIRDPITYSLYDGYTATVTLTQGLYRRANFLGISQANAALRQAQEEVLAAEQDLLLRLAQSLAALNQKEMACATLAEVGRKYPRASNTVKQGVEREQKRGRC